MNQLKLKAVTIDLWETLLFERDGENNRKAAIRTRNLAEAIDKCGVKTAPEQVAQAIEKLVSELVEIWDQNRDVTNEDQLRMIMRHLTGNTTSLKSEWMGILSEAYVSPISGIPPHLNPDALDLLNWLKERRLKVGLICNTGLTPGRILRPLLVEMGVGRLFDLMIFSDEVKMRKPSLEIFRIAATELDVRPCEIVHVGDNLISDIFGAKAAGFRSVHLNSDEYRDRVADTNPRSLVTLARNLGAKTVRKAAPDTTITSLSMLKTALTGLENEPC